MSPAQLAWGESGLSQLYAPQPGKFDALKAYAERGFPSEVPIGWHDVDWCFALPDGLLIGIVRLRRALLVSRQTQRLHTRWAEPARKLIEHDEIDPHRVERIGPHQLIRLVAAGSELSDDDLLQIRADPATWSDAAVRASMPEVDEVSGAEAM
jgi:hypothetical protein